LGFIDGHGPVSNAFRAARTARSMSSACPWATSVSAAPVAGSVVANVFPDAASAHSPPINSFLLPRRNPRTSGMAGCSAIAVMAISRQ
jgi:hypothetical protein